MPLQQINHSVSQPHSHLCFGHFPLWKVCALTLLLYSLFLVATPCCSCPSSLIQYPLLLIVSPCCTCPSSLLVYLSNSVENGCWVFSLDVCYGCISSRKLFKWLFGFCGFLSAPIHVLLYDATPGKACEHLGWIFG